MQRTGGAFKAKSSDQHKEHGTRHPIMLKSFVSTSLSFFPPPSLPLPPSSLFLLFFGYACMWKFRGRGSNPCRSSDLIFNHLCHRALPHACFLQSPRASLLLPSLPSSLLLFLCSLSPLLSDQAQCCEHSNDQTHTSKVGWVRGDQLVYASGGGGGGRREVTPPLPVGV